MVSSLVKMEIRDMRYLGNIKDGEVKRREGKLIFLKKVDGLQIFMV